MKANLSQREAEKSYGLTGDELTASLNWTAYSFRKDWNQAKPVVAPWWGENFTEAPGSAWPNCGASWTTRAGRNVLPELRGDGKRARWKPR